MSSTPSSFTSFSDVVVDLVTVDSDVFVIDCDLSRSSGTTDCRSIERDRFLNVGVSEQNAVGIACGMARIGFKPLVHSFAAFVTMRAFEFIRTGVAYQRLDVKICATKGGIENAQSGPTHHGIEDLALMRLVPYMHVVAPKDFNDLHTLLGNSLSVAGPFYFRVPRKGVANTPIGQELQIGELALIEFGSDLLLLFTGSLYEKVLQVLQQLKVRGIRPTVAYCHTLKPFDSRQLSALLKNHRIVAVFEEHLASCGLTSIVREHACPGVHGVESFGLDEGFIYESCDYDALFQKHCFDVDRVVDRLLRQLNSNITKPE